jgi:hypothetical protein
MSKIKMRCITCGKWFQSANAKEVTCPDCVQKARREKLAAKNAPAATERPAGTTPTRSVPPPPKPKPAASGTGHWFDKVSDVKISEPDKPPPRPKPPVAPDSREQRGPGSFRDERGPGSYRAGGPGGYRDRDERGPGDYRSGGPGYHGGYRSGGPGTLETPGYRPRQPLEGGRGPRPGPGGARPEGKRTGKQPKARTPTPPKPKREKIPPPQPFVPTPEQVAQIEARYAELAVPQEYDGIRTQIAKELGIPKKAVKKVVLEYRKAHDLPSWWETQTYKGDSEELAKIKAAYEPYLPVPPVGIHKKIAEELGLKAGEVYQAIKAIRLEMNLPQFNDPELHAEELAARQKQREAEKQAKEESTEAPAEAGADNAVPVAASVESAPSVEDAASVDIATPAEGEKIQPAEE